MGLSVSTVLALLANAGTIEDSVTVAVAKFTALLAAAKNALPQLKAFIGTLEGDAKAQFSALVAAFEDFASSAETARSDVAATAVTVANAVDATSANGSAAS